MKNEIPESKMLLLILIGSTANSTHPHCKTQIFLQGEASMVNSLLPDKYLLLCGSQNCPLPEREYTTGLVLWLAK